MATQSLTLPAGATADATGTATFSWQSIAPQWAWLVTVSVIGGLTASCTLSANGSALGSWQGASPAGPFYVAGPANLLLVASNLVPGQSYTAQAIGTVGTADQVPQQSPAPSVSSVQATRTQQLIQGLTNLVPLVHQTIAVTLSPNWRALYIGSVGGPGLSYGTSISVTGVQSGLAYTGIPCQFGPIGNVSRTPALFRFALFQGLDSVVNVRVANDVNPDIFIIGADNDLTDLAIDSSAITPVVVQPERGDGFPLPLNSKGATAASSATSGTLIAAPGVGLSIELGTLLLVTGTGTAGAATLTGTIAGTAGIVLAQGVAASTGPAGYDRAAYATGLVLDPNTAVLWATSGTAPGTTRYTATYDVIAN